jgi:hypothetical protein
MRPERVNKWPNSMTYIWWWRISFVIRHTACVVLLVVEIGLNFLSSAAKVAC